MEPDELALILAKLRLEEATPRETDAFISWAIARNPDGPRLRQLAGMVPLSDELAWDFVAPGVAEAGLTAPEPLDAALTAAREEMRRIVAREIEPEEGSGRIENLASAAGLDHELVSRTAPLWNFCVYNRYLRGACDVGDSGWYGVTVDDIVAEAEYHLGLRDRPPPSFGDPDYDARRAEEAAARRAEAPPAPPPPAPPPPAPRLPAQTIAADAPALAPTLGGVETAADEFFALGRAYQFGDHVPRDPAKAAAYYRRAANLGHPAAYNSLGWLYQNGEGVDRDRAKALESWFAAAERGHAAAQCSVGYAYESGDGVAQDYAQAVAWYERAAAGGSGTAHTNLGYFYELGEVLPQDLPRAAECYRRGANLGEARAQYRLGLLYQRGDGVPRDHARAAEWFRQAYENLNRQRR